MGIEAYGPRLKPPPANDLFAPHCLIASMRQAVFMFSGNSVSSEVGEIGKVKFGCSGAFFMALCSFIISSMGNTGDLLAISGAGSSAGPSLGLNSFTNAYGAVGLTRTTTSSPFT